MPTTANFDERLAALRAHDLEGDRDEPALAALVRFAADLCAGDAASVNLLDQAQVRTIAAAGLEGPMPLALVQRTVGAGALTGTSDHEALAGTGFAFHAGLPLRSEDGVILGTLAILRRTDVTPLTQLQRDGLTLLGEQVAVQFARRRVAREAREAASLAGLDKDDVRQMVDAIPQMVWSARPDGHHDFFNARWYQVTGTPPGSTDGEGVERAVPLRRPGRDLAALVALAGNWRAVRD